MKMMQIVRDNRFNQRTFYQWLLESGVAVKVDGCYSVGPKALPGMKNLDSQIVDKNGENRQITQVIIDVEQSHLLIKQYLDSGLDRLYSKRYYEELQEAEWAVLQDKVSEITRRLSALEARMEVKQLPV